MLCDWIFLGTTGMPASLLRCFFGVCCLYFGNSMPVAAQDREEKPGWTMDGWSFMTSLYTYHFDDDPEHVNDQNLFSVEAYFTNGWSAGLALFDNSFGQDSQFLFMSRKWQLSDSDYWYVVLRGGLLHGYKEPYEDKIPFNGLGVAPAFLPALGFRYRNFITELQVAGVAAVTVTAGLRF